MIELYDDQQDHIARARVALRTHRNIVFQGSTGSGKTVEATAMAHSALSKGNTVNFICHRRELLEQTSVTFSKAGLGHSFIAAGREYDRTNPLQICSIDTLRRRIETIPSPGLAFWDEGHHIGATSWSTIHDFWTGVRNILLTATPVRLDGTGLINWATAIVLGRPIPWLIEHKRLAPFAMYSPGAPDMSKVKNQGGDFARKQSSAIMDNKTVTGDAIREYRKHADGRQAIGFCASVEHSERMAGRFRDAGIVAVHLDGNTRDDDRRAAVEGYRRGSIRVLFNVDLFGEGFDVPEAECLIDLSPTMSLGRYLQRCGRVLRYRPGKIATINDHAGNWYRHGMPDQEREWSLDGHKPSRKEEQYPVRTCPMCFRTHPSAMCCPECNYMYPAQTRDIFEVDGELEKVKLNSAEFARIQRKATEGYSFLVDKGRRKGMKNPQAWARHVINGRIAAAVQKRTTVR